MLRRLVFLTVLAALVSISCGSDSGGSKRPSKLDAISNIIVIFQENWSFDGLFPFYPEANNITKAGDAVRQVDKNGRAYTVLPQPFNTSARPPGPDLRFPANLPVQPFDAPKYVPPEDRTGDLIHRFYQNQYQINGGKMDKFIAWSDAGGLVMSYYNAQDMPVGTLAQEYTMLDNFFQAAFGGSFLNHIYLVCACTPVWPNAPESMLAQLGPDGIMTRDGAVTPDGYAVNTVQPASRPFDPGTPDLAMRLPPQTKPTIGDRLTDKGIDWAWYAGGWNDAAAGRAARSFQYHHQPFNYFTNYGEGKPGRSHLKDEADFIAALQNGTLPPVAFVKPAGDDNEHPGDTSLARGQQHVADLVKAVQGSRYWHNSVIIIAYDEYGGRWDHVAPPIIDRWGPGPRVPAMVISPFAKKKHVDHTQYDTTSILALIETRWRLQPLTTRDANAANLLNALDLR